MPQIKVYSVFKIKGCDPVDGLHVTHKYIGKIEPKNAWQIYECVVNYFEGYRRAPFTVRFGNVEYFGPRKNIRVLTTNTPEDFDFAKPLFVMLNRFNPEKGVRRHPFTPHVTTATIPPRSWFTFDGYCLIFDKTVVYQEYFTAPRIN